jgi:predicted nucleic acid-binding protein
MTDSYLIDTNILVYCYDLIDIRKSNIALDYTKKLQQAGSGFLSTQILGEFFNAVTKRITEKLSPQQAYRSITNFYSAWSVFDITPMIVLEAAKGVYEHKFSFWDSQIWATARLNQINCILSEDFSHDSIIEGVRFFNPFL